MREIYVLLERAKKEEIYEISRQSLAVGAGMGSKEANRELRRLTSEIQYEENMKQAKIEIEEQKQEKTKKPVKKENEFEKNINLKVDKLFEGGRLAIHGK